MKKLLATILFLFIFSIYLFTLAPTVSFRDTGDLIASSYTLGISHPSGFPLFMLLGKIFTYLPAGTIAFRINLMSALFSSLTCLFVFLTINNLTKNLFIGVTATIFLGFSLTFWTYAEIGEKYSLYAFLSSVLIYLGVVLKKKLVVLYVFLFGLSLTHHLAIIIFLVPLIYLVYKRIDKRFFKKNYIAILIAFIIPLLLYLYLPLRAATDPLLNWGKPDSFERFIAHLTGKDYRYAMFSTNVFELIVRFKDQVIMNFVREFTIIGFILGILGCLYLFFKNKIIGIFLSLVICFNVLIFINYNILDLQNIGTYYLPAFIVFSIWIGAGIIWLTEKTKFKKTFSVVLLIFSISFIFNNFNMANRRNDYLNYDFGSNLIKSVENNSILMVNGDMPLFPLWYLQYVEGYNKNICIIPSYRINVIETIKKNISKSPVYFSYFPYESIDWKEILLVPSGVVYKVYKKQKEFTIDKTKIDDLWNYYNIRNIYNFNGFKNENWEMVSMHYAISHHQQGEFYGNNEFFEEAFFHFKKTLDIYPNYIESYLSLGELFEKIDIKKAKDYYKKALEIVNVNLKRDETRDDLKEYRLTISKVLYDKSVMSLNSGKTDLSEYFFYRSERFKK
ncbi:MAG: DUF2723 domain-containing protein [Candidatus Firestonebacteria bacterium]